MPAPRTTHRAASPLRCALRALADPSIVEGASTPQAARRGQESKAVSQLMSLLFSTRIG